MTVATVGPEYGGAWTTRMELEFVEGLGKWRHPEWVPADADSPRAYRVLCLRGYLSAMEHRALLGCVTWSEVRARVVELLRAAEERAA